MTAPQPAVDAGRTPISLHLAPRPARFDTLPRSLTPLVGRARQRAELTALLRDPQVRLLTLIGPGGVGKTRLALAAAELADPEYTDGTLFVPLAAVVDPGLVLPSIAAILDVKEGEGPVEFRVALVLANRQILLVLDNFEQVAPAGTAMALCSNRRPE